MLGLLQLVSQAILLLTLPYLARTLGVEAFGQVALTQVLMQYLVMLVDYGFNWSATQRIAAKRGDQEFLSTVFSNTLAAQLALAATSSFCLAVLWWVAGQDRLPAEMLLAGLSFVWGAALTPLWLLHGVERMQEAALIQLLGRLAVLPLLLLFVQGPAHATRAVWILGGTTVLSGTLMVAWALRHGLVQWQRPRLKYTLERFQVGFPVFLSMVFISFYTVLPGLVLGMMASASVFAAFVVADRIRGAVQALLQPLPTALLPRMSHLFATDRPQALVLLRRAVWVSAVAAGFAGAVLFFGAPSIVPLLVGEGYAEAVKILRWLSPLPLVIALGSLAGLQVLLPNRRLHEFNAVLVCAGVFGVLTLWLFVGAAQAVGVALFLLVTEAAVSVAMWCLAYRCVLRAPGAGVNHG
jgi:O-antigen/teichoic acid export membrane protein